MLGFVGDVGDLAKLVRSASGVRATDADASAALAHEVADCLRCVRPGRLLRSGVG
jgi:hypothetical protein